MRVLVVNANDNWAARSGSTRYPDARSKPFSRRSVASNVGCFALGETCVAVVTVEANKQTGKLKPARRQKPEGRADEHEISGPSRLGQIKPEISEFKVRFDSDSRNSFGCTSVAFTLVLDRVTIVTSSIRSVSIRSRPRFPTRVRNEASVNLPMGILLRVHHYRLSQWFKRTLVFSVQI